MLSMFLMPEEAMAFRAKRPATHGKSRQGGMLHPKCHYCALLRNMQISLTSQYSLACQLHTSNNWLHAAHALHFIVSNLAAPISLFRSEHNDFGLRLLNNLEKNRSNRIQSSE